MKPQGDISRYAASRCSLRGFTRRRRVSGFTLVELLVVISIMGVLAGLTVGLSGVASRKSKEGRIRGDLNRLVTLIENYKAKMGFYPPSPDPLIRLSDATNPYDIPSPRLNQLFYELSGTVYTNPPARFYVPGRPALGVNEISSLFQTDGFANSSRDRRGVRFTTEFKASDVKQVAVAGVANLIDILVAPVAPPVNSLPSLFTQPTVGGGRAYPWFYDSSSTNRMNTDGFDLWTVVEIGKKIMRFSNWESGPVVVGP